MNWWTLVTLAWEVVQEVPTLIDDVQALVDKLHGHQPAPLEVRQAMPTGITFGSQP